MDSFSDELRDGGNKREEPARKECDYCNKSCNWAQGHDDSSCLHKQRDDAEAKLQAIKERHAGKGRQARRPRMRRKPSHLLFQLHSVIVNQGPAASAAAGNDKHSDVSTRLPSVSCHPVAFSATAALDQLVVRDSTVDTVPQLHVCGRNSHAANLRAFCSKASLTIPLAPSAPMWFFRLTPLRENATPSSCETKRWPWTMKPRRCSAWLCYATQSRF